VSNQFSRPQPLVARGGHLSAVRRATLGSVPSNFDLFATDVAPPCCVGRAALM
jgi:hypothetical protein